MAKGGTAAAKKPQPAPQAKKPTGLAAVASNKGNKGKPAAAAPTDKKRERVTHPAGTEQTFMLTDGTEVPAIWRGEKGKERLCCSACGYKFPVRAQAAENALKRKEKLAISSQETFRHFARMIRKNAARLGEPIPTAEEIAQLMLAGANDEDADLEAEVE